MIRLNDHEIEAQPDSSLASDSLVALFGNI
jgi:hypothetical protein